MMRQSVLLMACLALLVGAIAQVARAQLLYALTSPNPEQDGHFGWSVSCAGDVNSDGYDDLIVGACWEDGGAPEAGRAYILSGNDGGLIHALESPNAEAAGYFGWPVSSAGDVNGDGYGDVVVGACWEDGGAPDAGRAYIFGGNDGGLLQTLESPKPEDYGYFGYWLSGAGDVNGDAYKDVIVGAPLEDGGAPDAGRAYIFRGNDGGLLFALQSAIPEQEGYFGASISGAGDVNNDGFDDVMVGAYQEDAGAWDAGRAYIFSGEAGSLLYTLESPGPEDSGVFGYAVSGVGDVNNDEHDDVIVGACFENGGAADAGRAYLFDGNGAGLLYTLESPTPEYMGMFGCSISGAGDVNNDGYEDVLAGALREGGGTPDAGRAHIFSGEAGSLLYTLESPTPEYLGGFGSSVSGAGDVNNDMHADVAVGAFCEDGGAPDAGRVYIFNGIEVPVELAFFRAGPAGGTVRLVWVTLTERDNLGFNVDRAHAESGVFSRLNEELIPGAGTTTIPHTYRYVDEMVELGCTYWYRLEDVSLAGKRTSHGPIRVAVPAWPGLGLEVLGGSEPTLALSFAGPGWARLSLYDVTGRLTATLWEGEAPDGRETLVRLQACRTLPPGLYAAVLSQDGVTVKRRVALLR